MSKSISIFISVLFISFVANAADHISLNDAFDSQDKVVISPVLYKGSAVYSRVGARNAAVMLCSLLSYSRMVDFKSVSHKGDKFLKLYSTVAQISTPSDYRGLGGKVAGIDIQIKETAKLVNKFKRYSVLTSVTCAK